jgi:hypothetical protein
MSEDPIFVNYNEAYPGEETGVAARDKLRMDWSHGHNNAVVNGIGRIGFMKGGKSALWKDEKMSDQFTHHAVEFIKQCQKKKSPLLRPAPCMICQRIPARPMTLRRRTGKL